MLPTASCRNYTRIKMTISGILFLLMVIPQPIAWAQASAGDLYALIVGVSNYRNPTITQLKVSDKDARDFARFLETQSGLFRRVNVKLLTNEQATKAAVEDNLYYWLRKSGKDDTVLLFFSGHGADDPYHPDKFYFVAHDSDPKNLQGTGVNMSGLEFLRPLDSKRIVLIADTCHAGGYSMQGTKRVEPVFQRFVSQFQESQGRVIITSCQPNELSMEKPGLPNSVFTHYLLEGLSGKADSNGDGMVTLKEAYEYVYERAKDATSGIQHPQFEGRFVGLFPLALARLNQIPTVRTEPSKPTPQDAEGIISSDRHSDRIVAVVNNDVILESDLKKQKLPFMRNALRLPLGTVPPGKSATEKEILDELIVIRLLAQEVAKKGIKVDEKGVDASIDAIKKRTNLTQNQFLLFLAGNGVTYDDIRNMLKRQWTLTRLIERSSSNEQLLTFGRMKALKAE